MNFFEILLSRFYLCNVELLESGNFANFVIKVTMLFPYYVKYSKLNIS